MQIETRSGSTRFKTAESELRRLNHRESRYNGVVSKLGKHIGPKHSAEKFRKCSYLPEHIGPKHSAEKFRKCNYLPMAVTKVYSTFA